jgi:hypothetical protein
MVETLVTNRGMLFNPTYGRIGTIVLPLFTVAEAIGPLLEGLVLILIPIAWYLGALNVDFFITFFLLTTGFGIFLSWFGIFSEVWSFNRYDDPRQILRLLWYGVLENFGYRQWKTYVAWRGLFQYLTGKETWGVMERGGFATGDSDPAEPATDTTDRARLGDSRDDATEGEVVWGEPAARLPDDFEWQSIHDGVEEREGTGGGNRPEE